MCNFIIRKEVASYATVDVELSDGSVIAAGSKFEVETVTQVGDRVRGKVGGDVRLVPLNIFVHTFSDKDPNKKEKKEAK